MSVGGEGREADVIVVGAGVAGLATAWAVAGRGMRVSLLEQFTVGHRFGSSHGDARIFKLSYPDEEFVRLAQSSLVEWRQLEQACGEEILSLVGSLDVGGIAGRREALDACGVAYEFVDATTIETRFGLAVRRDAVALFQPEGGVLHADRARAAFLHVAEANGVTLVEHARVDRLVVNSGSILLETTAGTFGARAVVVTAGAWVNRIVGGIGLALNVTPTRETVAYFEARTTHPVPTLSEWRPDEGRVNYGLVNRNGLLKVGVSGSGSPTDPDEQGQIDQAVVREASDWAARHFVLVDDAPVSAESCLYTNTSDERFILEQHERLIVGSACSGHGFKFAPAVGRRLAAMALDAAVS